MQSAAPLRVGLALNLAGIEEIQKFGIDKFNEACRGTVLKYTGEWRKTVRRMGRWVDFDNVQPYSPALATPLSNFETNQGYKDRQDPSITLIFPLAERKGESLLVWTTTPWKECA